MAPSPLQTQNRDGGPEPPTSRGFCSTLRRHLFGRKRDGNKSTPIETAGVSAGNTCTVPRDERTLASNGPRTSESTADNVQVPYTVPEPEDEYFGPISALWGEEYANLAKSEEEGDDDCFFTEYKSIASKLLGISTDDLASNKPDQRAETARVQKTLEGLIDEKKWILGPFGVKEAIKATVEVVNGARDLVGAGITASGCLPASLAWSGVCILLLPLVSALAANDERVNSLQDIAVIIAICDARESFYAREFEEGGFNKIKQSNIAHGVFRQTLSRLYGDILRFYARNVYYLSRNTPARFLRDFAKRDDWKAQLQGIKEKATAVDKAVSEVLIQHRAEFQRLLTAIGQNQVKLLQSQVNLLQSFVERAERDDRSQILKSLKVIDHEAMLSSIRDQRPKRTENVPSSLSGTHGASAAVDNEQHLTPYPVGKWLLENKEFVDWKTSPNSVLWLHGHVGAGKTLLSETVITHLNGHVKLCREQAKHAAVAYCFIRFSEPKTFKRDNIVKSLIAQFYAAGPATAAALLLREQMAELRDEKEIGSVLQEFISSCPGGAYIVIDGVDECPDTGPVDSPYGGEPSNPRQHLLDLLQALPGRRSENLHLFVSSRPAPDIRGLLCRINPRIIDLGDCRAETDHDISDLIDATLGESSFEGSCLHKNETLKSSFKRELLKKANGVIQYARIALSRISREVPLNETQLSELLAKLPEGLNALYKEALTKLPKTHHETIRRLLIWQRFFVHGPMNLAEVGEACRIPLPAPEQPDFKLDPSFPNPRGIVDRLPGILLVQKSPGVHLPDPETHTDWVVTVGHYSFIEFLQSSDIITDPRFEQVKYFAIDVDKTRMELAFACLSYLLHSSRQVHLYCDLEQFLKSFPLFQRSAEGSFELAEHVHHKTWPQPFRDALEYIFFGPMSKEPIRLLKLLAVDEGPGCGSYDYAGALTYLVDFGHTRILRFILKELLLREENNSLSDSSLAREDLDIGLHRACAFDLPDIVTLLLRYQANPQTPAKRTCASNDPDICQRLQADPHAARAHAGKHNPTCAVGVALQNHAARALRALLEWHQGEALQSCNEKHHTHLISAAMKDDKRCFYELLQRDPYVGAEIDGLPVLHILVLYHSPLSTFLRSSVGSKVDYRARDRCFGTALQCAVAIGRGGSVHDLLMAGASMDDPSDPAWETLLRDMSKGEHFNLEWFVTVWGFPDGDKAAARLRAFQEVFGDRCREPGLSPEDRQHLADEAGEWVWKWEP